jgi:DNA adenine methylase
METTLIPAEVVTVAEAQSLGKPYYSHIRAERLTSLLKWAGGKEQELKYILPLLPSFNDYYEPFVGGGAVFFSIQSHRKFINDRSPELFNLYMLVAEQNRDFFDALDMLLAGWLRISELVEENAGKLIGIYKAYSLVDREQDAQAVMDQELLGFVYQHGEVLQSMFSSLCNINSEKFLYEIKRNLLSKTRRMRILERKKGDLPDGDIAANFESALKSAYYMHLRHLYNKTLEYEISPALAAAIYFFVRENAYAAMFRYNSQGEFNVPYGGISYNRKDLARKVAYLQSSEVGLHLNNTVIENMDFEAFLQKHDPQANDFIFLDPPYDSEFSTYARNEFARQDQERLSRYLLDSCKARFMLVIKNTAVIRDLYCQRGLNVRVFDKKYLVSFQDRNKRDAEHLIIMNYQA